MALSVYNACLQLRDIIAFPAKYSTDLFAGTSHGNHWLPAKFPFKAEHGITALQTALRRKPATYDKKAKCKQ